MQEYELDNLLMAQKNDLLGLLNEAFHTPDYVEELRTHLSALEIERILDRLIFVLPMWNAANYGYKAREIVNRIEAALRNSMGKLHHAASERRRQLLHLTAQCRVIYAKSESVHNVPDTHMTVAERKPIVYNPVGPDPHYENVLIYEWFPAS